MITKLPVDGVGGDTTIGDRPLSQSEAWAKFRAMPLCRRSCSRRWYREEIGRRVLMGPLLALAILIACSPVFTSSISGVGVSWLCTRLSCRLSCMFLLPSPSRGRGWIGCFGKKGSEHPLCTNTFNGLSHFPRQVGHFGSLVNRILAGRVLKGLFLSSGALSLSTFHFCTFALTPKTPHRSR